MTAKTRGTETAHDAVSELKEGSHPLSVKEWDESRTDHSQDEIANQKSGRLRCLLLRVCS